MRPMQEIVREIVEAGEREESDELLLPSGARTRIERDAFVPLSPKPLPGRVCFVDGGNACVFDSPAVRVEFVRLYACAHEGLEKKDARLEEGFVLVRNVTRDGRGYVQATGYAPLSLTLLVPDDDKELRSGKERVQLAAVASLARFVLECRFAKRLGEGCDLVVRDGQLLGMNRHEEEALAELASGLGFHIAGVSKTTSLLTATGGSGAAALERLAPGGMWRHCLGLVDGIELHAVKLHARAEHVFRLDLSPDASAGDAAGPVAAGLASLARDPSFLGYPYPLVAADRMARVPNKEAELLRTRFMMEAGGRWRALERLARGTDAHAILDRI